MLFLMRAVVEEFYNIFIFVSLQNKIYGHQAKSVSKQK